MRIAMFGTGGMAQRHCRALSTIDGIKIVAHASPTAAHVEAAAAQWGGRAYGNHRDLLARETIDAAWIAVPPDQHGALERALIEREVPFLVEKPLAADLHTAEKIVALLAEKSLIVAAGYHWRAMETVPGVRQALVRRAPRLIIAAWHDVTPPPTWWRRRERSGGQLIEQATHLFDFVRYVNGEGAVLAATAEHSPRDAYPNLDVDTSSAVLLRFANGAVGTITATCLLQGTPQVDVRFMCDGLVVTVRRDGVTYDDGRQQREVRLVGDPVRSENLAFLRAVQNDDPSLLYCSYEDALQSHRLCCMAQQLASGADMAPGAQDA